MTDTEQIEAAAMDALLSVHAVCKKAGVSYSTFHRAKNGGAMRALTKAKLMRAIEALRDDG